MKTVGEVIDRLEDVCAMIDSIYRIDNSVNLNVDKEELLGMLREYCRVLRSLKVANNG